MGGGALHRIEDVEARFNEGLDEPLDRPAGVLEAAPCGVAVDPVAHRFVVGQPEFAEGRDGTETGRLRTEVGAANEEGVDRIADARMNALQVGEGDFALTRKHRVYIVAARTGRHIPFGDVSDAARVLHVGPGNQRDVAKGRAAEAGDQRAAAPPRLRHIFRDLVEVARGERLELFQIVFRIQSLLVDGRLADNRVEEKAAFGHAPAGRHAAIPFRVNESVAGAVDVEFEAAANENLHAVEAPRLPVLIAESEHVAAPVDALHIDPHRLLQVLIDHAEHLVRLVNLHRPFLQAIEFAQPGHAGSVNASDGGAAEVDGDAIRGPVCQRFEHALAGRSEGGGGGHVAYLAVKGQAYRKV